MHKSLPFSTPLILFVCGLLLSACSFLPGKNDEPGAGGTGRPLEVPPDLTRPQSTSQLAVPSHTQTTFSDYSQGQRVAVPRGVLLPQTSEVSVQRDGDLRWLSVQAKAVNLWRPVLGFLSKNGYLIDQEDARIGLIETRWKEQGMVIGDSFTKSMFANLINSDREPATRDRLRVRMERGAKAGTTDIYLTREAQIEVMHDEDMVWENRKNTRALEAETLSRLMVYLGESESGAAAKVAATQSPQARATLSTVDGKQYILISEDLGRAWRLTGVALDRAGFTIEGRDHDAGIYQVSYIDHASEEATGGFFSRLFTPTHPAKAASYQIKLTSSAGKTRLTLRNGQGKAANSATAGRILKQLYKQLR